MATPNTPLWEVFIRSRNGLDHKHPPLKPDLHCLADRSRLPGIPDRDLMRHRANEGASCRRYRA